VASLGLLAAIPGTAEGQERLVSGTVGVSSDYTFRGVSQTLGNPALQVSADLDLPAGFYAWAWGSNVDFVPDGQADDNARTEIDLALGYAGDIGDNLGIEVELIRYVFPGTSAGINYDYGELLATIRYDERYHATLAYSNNVDGTGRHSRFYRLGGQFDLWNGATVGLDYGLFDLRDAYGHAYSFLETSLAQQIGDAVVALGYVNTYGAADVIYGDRVIGARFVMSLKLNW
jgi:uncharacterized protein (TIGR02001 family)